MLSYNHVMYVPIHALILLAVTYQHAINKVDGRRLDIPGNKHFLQLNL